MDARVIAYIDHLGKFDGLVMSVLQRGFVMSVNAKQHERRKLAAKIEWLQQHKEFRKCGISAPTAALCRSIHIRE